MATAFSRSVRDILEQTPPRGESLDSIDFLRAMGKTRACAFERALHQLAIPLETLQEGLDKVAQSSESQGSSVSFYGESCRSPHPVTPELVQALENAKGIADRIGSLSVDTHHIALGMLGSPDCLAHSVLRDLVVSDSWEREIKAYGDLDVEPETAIQCHKCGLVSPAPYIFRRAIDGNDYCSRCLEQESHVPGDFFVVGTALFVLTTLMAPSAGTSLWLVTLANFLFYLLFRFPAAWLHEFGHFMAARLVGFDVSAVVIGNGEPKVRRSIAGYPVVLTPWIGYTRTRVFPITSKGYRWRSTFYLLGGTVANSLAALGLLALGAAPSSISEMKSLHPLFMLFLANAMAGLPVLLPFRSAAGQPSDGMAMMAMWKQRFEPFERTVGQRYALISRSLTEVGLDKFESVVRSRFRRLDSRDPLIRSLDELDDLAEGDWSAKGVDEELLPFLRHGTPFAAAWKLVFQGEASKALPLLDRGLEEQPRNHFGESARCYALIALGSGSETLETLRKLVRDPALVSRTLVVTMSWYVEDQFGSRERAEAMKRTALVLDLERSKSIYRELAAALVSREKI